MWRMKNEEEETEEEKARRVARHETFIYWLLDQEGYRSAPDSSWLVPLSEYGNWATAAPEGHKTAEVQLVSTVLGGAVPRATSAMVARLIYAAAKTEEQVHTRQSWGPLLGSSIYNMVYTTRVTPLDVASLFWDVDAIRVLLDHCAGDGVDRTAMVNAMDSKGRLPLHWALTRSQGIPCDRLLETVTLLVEADPATVNVPHPKGPPPVSQAIGNTLSFSVLRLLLAHGADARSCDPGGRNLLHQLTLYTWDQPLDFDLIDRVLEQVRVNDPAPVDGSTALHYLVRHWDQLDLPRYLIQCGATVNTTNRQGNTLLHEVMRCGLFVFDRRGRPRPLEPVASARSIQARDAMLGVLIEAGGSMDQRNGAGDTPTQVWDQVTERQRRRLQQRDAARQLLARGRGPGIIDARDNNIL